MTSPSLSGNRAQVGANSVDGSRIWLAGLVAVVGSVIANLVLRFLLNLTVGLDSNFLPFQLPPIVTFTVIPTVLAVALFALLVRFTRQPARIFTLVALVAAVVSLLPNLLLAINPAAAPAPGGQSSYFLILMLFHLPPALICIWALTSLTRARR